MENQSKKSRRWGFRGLLLVALSGITVMAHAQGAEVCQGTGYTIANAVPASVGSEYRWLENGNVLANTNRAAYNVPDSKAAGVYTYVRQSKSADCPDWQSSNEFTLTVFACSFTAGTATGATATFTDARDGKQYKTVVMPDGRTWFAQNLNYTKDLTFNTSSREANGKMFIINNGALAIGSYWCPGVAGSMNSGDQNACNIYGALYTWETAMMVDGKYADETKTSSAWDEAWVSPYYYDSGSIGSAPNADRNNARGGTSAKDGGRGICPMGWHIPTAREWAIMLDSVEGDGKRNLFASYSEIPGDQLLGTDAGQKLKSVKTYVGDAPDPGDGSWRYNKCCVGQDTYGFNMLPAGSRGTFEDPRFLRGRLEIVWTCTVWTAVHGTMVMVQEGDAAARLATGMSRSRGNTIRCIKD